ncbi:MAG: hypothetical protein HKN57_13175 [Xanthomonadales bacterium]|nr:hypothetical protein [Gammaproteobacteria bacterium]MBT8054879.1 hypothetical protein [Gammaproteobacteria bacterium]NND58190.1 hypothetical protein [Xanthomonadales bacterium]NNK50047.1 hypothetical protein [Xanthomonadales bacterium]
MPSGHGGPRSTRGTHELDATPHWPRRIGVIIQVLTGQIESPHCVPYTCWNLATCALFLLSATGIFRRTRNPLYLALLLLLIGWAIYLANLFSLLLAACFIAYMNRFQIVAEEHALEKNSVRRFTTTKLGQTVHLGRQQHFILICVRVIDVDQRSPCHPQFYCDPD